MKRVSQSARETQETKISVSVCLDGSGEYEIRTGNGMFDHLLAQIARHGLIDLTILAEGDIQVGWHHIVEDVAIIIGQSFSKCIGDGKGITRTSHSYVPLDETLVRNVIDSKVAAVNSGIPESLVSPKIDPLASGSQ